MVIEGNTWFSVSKLTRIPGIVGMHTIIRIKQITYILIFSIIYIVELFGLTQFPPKQLTWIPNDSLKKHM